MTFICELPGSDPFSTMKTQEQKLAVTALSKTLEKILEQTVRLMPRCAYHEDAVKGNDKQVLLINRCFFKDYAPQDYQTENEYYGKSVVEFSVREKNEDFASKVVSVLSLKLDLAPIKAEDMYKKVASQLNLFKTQTQLNSEFEKLEDFQKKFYAALEEGVRKIFFPSTQLNNQKNKEFFEQMTKLLCNLSVIGGTGEDKAQISTLLNTSPLIQDNLLKITRAYADSLPNLNPIFNDDLLQWSINSVKIVKN